MHPSDTTGHGARQSIIIQAGCPGMAIRTATATGATPRRSVPKQFTFSSAFALAAQNVAMNQSQIESQNESFL
jgi:hypothetical protein